jgi:hypothetical protein
VLDDLTERAKDLVIHLFALLASGGRRATKGNEEFLTGRQSYKEPLLLVWMRFERIEYSDHAMKRMKQRWMTELEIEHVLAYLMYIKKSAFRKERGCWYGQE